MTIRERLWAKANDAKKRPAAVGLASFLARFYVMYDRGDRNRTLQEQVAWLWTRVDLVGADVAPPIDTDRKAEQDRYIPDVDFDDSPAPSDPGIGQVAALAVFSATGVVRGDDDKEPSDLWDYFDECLEHASETEDDEAAYSAGCRALRGLPPEQMMAGLDASNHMPRKSQHAKRVRLAFREAEAAVQEFLKSSDPTAAAVVRMREQLERIDVQALLYRWDVPKTGA